MKLVFCMLVMVVVANATFEKRDDDEYDLDEILPNKRLVINYIKCALDQGKCTLDAKNLKRRIKKALTFDCVECNEKEKNDTRRVAKHLIENEGDFWKQLLQKYDPDLKVGPKYEKEFGQPK